VKNCELTALGEDMIPYAPPKHFQFQDQALL
jgi:hypothetical protein